MKKKSGVVVYSIIWAIAILFLMFSLYHIMGNARVINYTGIIRGGSQKLVKQELESKPNDELIDYLDTVLLELQSGKGNNNLIKINNTSYQNQLNKIEKVWKDIKLEIKKIRQGFPKDPLYKLSETHFDMSNKAVSIAEKDSDQKVQWIIIFLIIYLIISLGSLYLWNRRRQKEVHDATYIDPLTGIYNLAGFTSKVEETLKKIPNQSFVLIDLDIDNFKYFNDNYSYEKGNELLKMIARYLNNIIEKDEICARIGSNNFILFVRKNHSLFTDFRKKLNHEAQEKLLLVEPIRFSTGGYLIVKEESITDLMDKANIALKSSKARGKNQFVWYNEELLKIIREDNKLINQMHKGLHKEEFKLYLQPKFNIHTQKIISAEALVRWHWDKEVIMPNRFISLFEKNGYIFDLDFYMLEQTCRFLQERCKIDSKYNIPISVNFSRVTLLSTNFLKKFMSVVDSYHISAHLLEVEVTESAFNEIADSVLSLLNQLKDKNFSISMDDFGNGYSSLSLLIKLPINILKLDKSFLIEKDKKEKTRKILASLVEMAHNLELQVICEGVETIEDVRFLKDIHCDYGQGFYFSRPIPNEEFIEKYFKC